MKWNKPVKMLAPLLAAALITGFGLLLSGTARAETAPQQADMQSAAALEEPEQTVSEAPVEHIEPKLLALEETALEPEEAQPEAEPAPDDAAGSAVPDDLELLDTLPCHGLLPDRHDGDGDLYDRQPDVGRQPRRHPLRHACAGCIWTTGRSLGIITRRTPAATCWRTRM